MATKDGEFFVSGCRDGSIRVFDIEVENCVGVIEKAHQGIFSYGFSFIKS